MENSKKTKSVWHMLIERANNFHWDSDTFKKQIEGKEYLYEDLHNLCEVIADNLSKPHEIKNELMPRVVFKEIFDFWFNHVELLKVFNKDEHLTEDVLDAYFFYALVMFITSTNKSDGISLRKFTYKHSKNGYNTKGSRHYFNFDYPGEDGVSCYENLKQDETAFRQARYRVLESRFVYIKRPEWSAMSKSSEHEWSFHYFLDNLTEDNPLRDTFKRIGNLYKDIRKSILPPNDKEYLKKEETYPKFMNKLKKIKYEKYLDLSKVILEHISMDKQHYGINLYRFERMFRLHNITSTISILLGSNDEKEKRHILLKDVYLDSIDFPRLYQTFSTFEDFPLAKQCAETFLVFKDTIAISCCLIFDALVKKKCFGDDWENLFLGVINEMSKKIYYDPEKIDYTIEPKSQEYFEKIRSVLVRHILNIPLFLDKEDSDSL